MATSRMATSQTIAGFLGRGLLLGVFGIYLAGILFINLAYVAIIVAIAIAGSWPSPDLPGLYLLRYTVPLGLLAGLAVGGAWERSARSKLRWWRIVVSVWAGLLFGGFPVSILLMLGTGSVLVFGFLPGLLAGLVWIVAITAYTLLLHRPLRDSMQYSRSARRLSAALAIPVGSFALIAGLSVIYGKQAMIDLLGEFVPAGSIDAFNISYLAIGLSAALVAWFLTPGLTDWYVKDSRPSSTAPPSDSPRGPTRDALLSPDLANHAHG